MAASTGMRALVPMCRKLIAMCSCLGLAQPEASQVSTVWEDNRAALLLATANPPKMTPQSKSLAVKYHWFRSQIQDGSIKMKPVASKDNLADILTKPRTQVAFQAAR